MLKSARVASDLGKRDKQGEFRPTNFRDEDEFADHIWVACGQALQLRQLLPMMTTLSAVGAEMERQGEISLLPGEDYAEKALNWLMGQYVKDEVL